MLVILTHILTQNEFYDWKFKNCFFLKDLIQTINNVEIKLFDRIVVKISIDAKNVQHQKMRLQLVYPKIEGFSVESEKAVKNEPDEEMGTSAKKAKK